MYHAVEQARLFSSRWEESERQREHQLVDFYQANVIGPTDAITMTMAITMAMTMAMAMAMVPAVLSRAPR